MTDCFRHLNPDEDRVFSWFDYRSKGFADDPKRGLRIDGILLTAPLLEKCQDAGVDYENQRHGEAFRSRAYLGRNKPLMLAVAETMYVSVTHPSTRFSSRLFCFIKHFISPREHLIERFISLPFTDTNTH